MLPQFPVEAYIHIITCIFGYQAQALLERRLIGDATYRTVPLAVITPLPMPVGYVEAEAMSFQGEVFGGGDIEV